MSNEKTVIEWLNEAKKEGHDWADSAIENCKNSRPYGGDGHVNSLSDAIRGGFVWPDGQVLYWEVISNELEAKGL